MPSYLSPGVYVEEVPSAVQAIAGVGTSTAGFIGILPDTVNIPRMNPHRNASRSNDATVDAPATADALLGVILKEAVNIEITLAPNTVVSPSQAEAIKTKSGSVLVKYLQPVTDPLANKTLAADIIDPNTNAVLTVTINNATIALTKGLTLSSAQVTPIRTALAAANIAEIEIQEVLDMSTAAASDVEGTTLLDEVPITLTLAADTWVQDRKLAEAVALALSVAGKKNVKVQNSLFLQVVFKPYAVTTARLCTSFGDFQRHFGGFTDREEQNYLAHAVFGFFHNGGTRCFVARMTSDTELEDLLFNFGAVDEIAIVAAPGLNDAGIRDKVVAHCKVATQDRMAIFDSPFELVNDDLDTLSLSNPTNVLPPFSDYAAFYFPWIQVFDPAKKTMDPTSDGRIFVPPSGHMAGIYARVDTNRGVHKAPANEPVLGALGLRYQISKAQQDGLNPQGVNCIRDLNGSIRIWGARTIGGDANGEWRYINVRRTFLFLRESIDEGTQWAVFEPNDEKLWAKITRNITAFLTTVWRSGALFGSTPDQAFYVKCDAETNPPELREVGQVVTEIGVAVVRPAEFVIFRISQWQPEQ